MNPDVKPAEPDLFARVRDLGPPELFDFLEKITGVFPDELKYRLRRALDNLPEEGDNLQRVLELVRAQWKDLQSDEWIKIAIVGPGRTGKNSLFRAITSRQDPPGTPIFSIVDTQGLDEFLGYDRQPAVPEELGNADVILLVLDGRYGISEATVEMHRKLSRLGKTLLVLLNKIDLVDDPGGAVRDARRLLKTNIFAVSVMQPETINRLLKGIVAANSRALYPLSQAFPEFRRTICNGIVSQASFGSGLVALVPIPVSDLLPMTAIQTAMLLKIARAFGFPINRSRARELLPMLAAGGLIREVSHRLRLQFPEQKKLIAVSVGGAWTYLLGHAAVLYFDRLARFVNQSETDVPHLSQVSSRG